MPICLDTLPNERIHTMIKDYFDKQIIENNTFYFPVYFELCKHDLKFNEACFLSYLIYKEPVCNEHPIYKGYFNCNKQRFMEKDFPLLVSTQPSGQKNTNKIDTLMKSLKEKGYIEYFTELNDESKEDWEFHGYGKRTYIKINEEKIYHIIKS